MKFWKLALVVPCLVAAHVAGAAAPDLTIHEFYHGSLRHYCYTASAEECAWLRQLETAQREEARASGVEFLGWVYEGVSFCALSPLGSGPGQQSCAAEAGV